MEHRVARLVDDGIPAAQDAIEDVEIAPALERRSRIQGLVEPSEIKQQIPAKTRVRTRPDNPGAHRMERVSELSASMMDALETTPESTFALEPDLRRRLEPIPQNQSGIAAGIRAVGPDPVEPRQPAALHDDIVVQVGDQVTARGLEGGVAREVEAGFGLEAIAYVGSRLDDLARSGIDRCVVDDQDLERSERGRAPDRLERFEQTGQASGPVFGADRDGQRRGLDHRRRVPAIRE
ncbi:hypothetical protein LT988_03545 [Thiocapsa bogorovii]|nr:hypothetical protein [Thiocapsa bogorovii]UHD17143.1 hypothetical protein LT988_03545 [Thiocapsa bogorovii]